MRKYGKNVWKIWKVWGKLKFVYFCKPFTVNPYYFCCWGEKGQILGYKWCIKILLGWEAKQWFCHAQNFLDFFLQIVFREPVACTLSHMHIVQKQNIKSFLSILVPHLSSLHSSPYVIKYTLISPSLFLNRDIAYYMYIVLNFVF